MIPIFFFYNINIFLNLWENGGGGGVRDKSPEGRQLPGRKKIIRKTLTITFILLLFYVLIIQIHITRPITRGIW